MYADNSEHLNLHHNNKSLYNSNKNIFIDNKWYFIYMATISERTTADMQ